MDIDNIGKRVLSIRKKKNLNQKQLSELASVTQSYLTVIERGKKKPSLNFVMSILKATKVSADWLLMGKGSMYPQIKGENQKIKGINDYRARIPIDLERTWEELSDKQKRELADRTKEMKEYNAMRELINKFSVGLENLPPSETVTGL
ncbi:MAG: helix-turn-helix domain-containing protein [Pseudomonadota bacterium]